MTDSKPYLSDVPPTYRGNMIKIIPLFREFNDQNPPIWAAHTRTNNMLCTWYIAETRYLIKIRIYYLNMHGPITHAQTRPCIIKRTNLLKLWKCRCASQGAFFSKASCGQFLSTIVYVCIQIFEQTQWMDSGIYYKKYKQHIHLPLLYYNIFQTDC